MKILLKQMVIECEIIIKESINKDTKQFEPSKRKYCQRGRYKKISELEKFISNKEENKQGLIVSHFKGRLLFLTFHIVFGFSINDSWKLLINKSHIIPQIGTSNDDSDTGAGDPNKHLGINGLEKTDSSRMSDHNERITKIRNGLSKAERDFIGIIFEFCSEHSIPYSKIASDNF